MVWFVSIVLLLYSLLNFYMVLRIRFYLADHPLFHRFFLVIFLILLLTYPVGRILEHYLPSTGARLMVHIGSFWLGYMVYFFLFILLADVFFLVGRFFFPPLTLTAMKFFVFLGMQAVIAGLLIAGNINANSIRVREVPVEIHRSGLPAKEYRVVLITDLHLGTIIRSSFLQKIVERTNLLEPDLILLGGDIVDEDVNSVVEQDMQQYLRQFRSGLGVYAITGNHEYISRQVETLEEYLRKSGILMLRDSVVTADSLIRIIGREDRAASRFRGIRRKPLEQLVNNQFGGIQILLDHQPFELHEAEKYGIDLQLSGHTHHGQLFPFQYITRRVYEISWGYGRRGNTHYYVSCGVGTWGPRIRLGNRPEIVLIRLKLNGE